MKANHVTDSSKFCTFIAIVNIQLGLCDVYQQRIDFMSCFKSLPMPLNVENDELWPKTDENRFYECTDLYIAS